MAETVEDRLKIEVENYNNLNQKKKELEVDFELDASWNAIKSSLGTNWKLAFSQTDRVNSKKLIEDILVA